MPDNERPEPEPEERRARALFIEHARGRHAAAMRLDCPSCRKLGFALWEIGHAR